MILFNIWNFSFTKVSEWLLKLVGIELLVADPPRCNCATRKNIPMHHDHVEDVYLVVPCMLDIVKK